MPHFRCEIDLDTLAVAANVLQAIRGVALIPAATQGGSGDQEIRQSY